MLILRVSKKEIKDNSVLSPQLMELFSRLGADGLLVEYEDMFPYDGELKLLQATAHPAYRCSWHLHHTHI